MTDLQFASAAALSWCLAAFALQLLHAAARGFQRAQAPGRGSAFRGVVYAFGPGMLPWNKDGARRHPLVFAGGVVLHLGVAAGAVAFAAAIRGIALPAPVGAALAATMLAGSGGAVSMLVRRLRSPIMRRISAPDDYVASLLVCAFLASGGVAAISSRATPAFLVAAVVLLLYAPLGKIRHCVFFPIARATFGASFGRRGVLGRPRTPSSHHSPSPASSPSGRDRAGWTP